MDVKKWILWIVMMGALVAVAFAQETDDDLIIGRGQTERWKFFREEIAPLISSERVKLNGYLSEEHQKTIDKLRDQMLNQQLMMLELQCERRAARLIGEQPDEALKAEIKAQEIVMFNTLREARAIAEKYNTEIAELLGNVREELTALRKDRQDDRLKNQQGRGRPMHGSGIGRGPSGDLSAVRFLLWDVG